jgi:hypothetical protein
VRYGDGDGQVSIIWLSSNAFGVPGPDLRAIYEPNRRVKIVGAGTGTVYGGISTSTFANSVTTVNVFLDSGSIHNEPLEPVPYYERGVMLREFPAQAQDKLLELAETANHRSPSS